MLHSCGQEAFIDKKMEVNYIKSLIGYSSEFPLFGHSLLSWKLVIGWSSHVVIGWDSAIYYKTMLLLDCSGLCTKVEVYYGGIQGSEATLSKI